jgi:hypothetical protein
MQKVSFVEALSMYPLLRGVVILMPFCLQWVVNLQIGVVPEKERI